jgi:hypothetical protein
MADQPEEVNELPEGAEMLPDEGQQMIDQKEKEVLGQILDKAASDPGFKQKMLDDPQAALQDAGVAEDVEALDSGSIGGLSDVAGQSSWNTKYSYRCLAWRTRRKLVHFNY